MYLESLLPESLNKSHKNEDSTVMRLEIIEHRERFMFSSTAMTSAMTHFICIVLHIKKQPVVHFFS